MICIVCSRKYVSEEQLRKHAIRVHSPKIAIQCKDCGKGIFNNFVVFFTQVTLIINLNSIIMTCTYSCQPKYEIFGTHEETQGQGDIRQIHLPCLWQVLWKGACSKGAYEVSRHWTAVEPVRHLPNVLLGRAVAQKEVA